MSLTGGYDFCVELPIAVIREIFHLAFKQEDRFPHNFGPLEQTFTVPGGTPLHAEIRVRVYDEEQGVGGQPPRAADLRFTAEREMTFSFPVDVEVLLAAAPSPELSRVIISTTIEVPGRLANLEASAEDGELALGLDFRGMSADDVVVGPFTLPIVDAAVVTEALHQAYSAGVFPHQRSESGLTLTIYDGARDPSLDPPNSTGAEISAALAGPISIGEQWVAISFPIHVGGVTQGYTVDTPGVVVLHRKLVRTDDAFILKLAEVPPSSDSAHQTTVNLVNLEAVDAQPFIDALHVAYAHQVFAHSYTSLGGTVLLYDGDLDTSLVPQHPSAAEIDATLEYDGAILWLHVQIPCYATHTSGISSFGHLHFHRRVEITTTQIIVHFEEGPNLSLYPERAARFELPDSAILESALNGQYVRNVDVVLAGIGPQHAPNPASALIEAIARAFDEFVAAFGDVAHAAPSEDRARELVRQYVAEYFHDRKFPVYTPDPGENEVALSAPVGRLLVADEILAIQLNRRAGTTEGPPEPFLGSNRLALAAGKEYVMERTLDVLGQRFPGLTTKHSNGLSGRHRVTEITDRKVWLEKLHVSLENGYFKVWGSCEVQVDCWWDPDVSFSGPVTLAVTVIESEEGCALEVEGVAGDFDVSQSSCDILLYVIIPIVGWIVGAVIAGTIAATADGVIDTVAEATGDSTEALPPVVWGIAEVWTCLRDIVIRSDGLVLTGDVRVRRVDRSFEDLEGDRRLPDGGDD
jgi:hypothetical protein